MKEYVPNCYASFHCIADRCRYSCCKDWEILIDDATLSLYRDLEGELGEKLRRNIVEDQDGASFHLDADRRCPFLQQDGLCELICKGGEELLCEICTLHPRYVNELPTRDEWGLGFCCEEACRVILSAQQPMTLLSDDDPFAETEADPNEEAFLSRRQAVLDVLQDRSRTIEQRLCSLEALYALPAPLSSSRAAALLLPLEQLQADWTPLLQAFSHMPETDETPLSPYENAFEQFAAGLVYRHFQRVYEGDALRRVLAFVVFSVRVVRQLALSAALCQGTLSFDTVCDLVRRYSSEIEYSDENVESLMDALEELPG